MQLGPFSDHPELDALAHALFRQFSRMEYALKAAGRLANPDGDAKANWTRFASEIDEEFTQLVARDDELRHAVGYIEGHPPKKQIVSNNVLSWSTAAPSANTSTGAIMLYVARVRNNLFHGGKFCGRWLDPERSEELLRACLTVLDRCLALSPEVREAYEH